MDYGDIAGGALFVAANLVWLYWGLVLIRWLVRRPSRLVPTGPTVFDIWLAIFVAKQRVTYTTWRGIRKMRRVARRWS